MPGNTKSRSNFLRQTALEIIISAGIDPQNPPADKRHLIRELAARGECHIETARTVIHAVLGALRWGRPIEAYNWGGKRPGSGKKSLPRDIRNSRKRIIML